ncbi:hypothetical protein BVRB_1g020340 [Beta vulgaris subsp. vulgaris]|nr:hypothetical protein BVRB_1g020340 [Beta vulgaris subsp. vulgaris]
MDSHETSLLQTLARSKLQSTHNQHYARCADKSVIDAAIEALKGLKLEKSSIEEQNQAVVKSNGGDSKEA